VTSSDPPTSPMAKWLIQAPKEVILGTLVALGALVVEVAVLHYQVADLREDYREDIAEVKSALGIGARHAGR
jgi:hypothetical protein